uniref:Retrovirus-related Pol polyprotein from transposon TNT 1-94-like beta-barrel domain-containing protein n=1 Tax=Nicotiana tabacum TaxID=4097 RepID=A0A1S3YP90_TOBAC
LLVAQALQGFPSSYRTFVSGLNVTGSLPSFIVLRPLLLTEEAHINANASEESNAQTVLLASTQAKTTSNLSSSFNENQPTKGYFHGRGRGKNNKGQYGRGRGYHNSSWSDFQHQSRPPSPATGILGIPPSALTKQCQIYFYYNRTALECINRFNHSFVANNIPKPFAAINLEEVQPTVWYPDSGASAHMTNYPSTLTSHTPYSGLSQVLVGDGTLLSIKSTGSSTLPTTFKPLLLKKVLYVPSLAKNLFSIQRLCADNNYFIEFTNSDFLSRT